MEKTTEVIEAKQKLEKILKNHTWTHGCSIARNQHDFELTVHLRSWESSHPYAEIPSSIDGYDVTFRIVTQSKYNANKSK